MFQTELFNRSSTMEDSTGDPKNENYRFRDTGYIAGSRKEMAVSYIRRMAKLGQRIMKKDIDWQAIEENPRQARRLITKSNIFGKVDWDTLRGNGMTGGTGFLIDRVYASVGAEPAADDADGRQAYSLAVDGLRDRLEKCKTVADVTETIREIRNEIDGDFEAVRKMPEIMELSQKLQEAYDKKRYLEGQEREIWEAKSEKGKTAQEFYDNEKEKTREQGRHKRRFSEEAWEEYRNLLDDARKEKAEQVKKIKKENGYLEAERISIKDGWSTISRGYMYNEVSELKARHDILYAQNAEEIIRGNPLYLAWRQLGDKFKGVLNYGCYNGSTVFHSHVAEARSGKHDNWEWASREKTAAQNRGQKRRAEFELKVASKIGRKGGRDIKPHTTFDLKKQFNLRDVQSGKWVLSDPDAAKFHVDNIASGLADLGDVTGIPDVLLSMNGRLAIAIGARGHGSVGGKTVVAHYEPIERVINITKMKGGGSLAHEWFHAFDNLLSESMIGGNIDLFFTNPHRGQRQSSKN